MVSCQLMTFLNDRLVAQARPFPFPCQRQSDIQYKYWKRSPLQNRKGLACETKPTVCKHKQKQMKLSLSNRELMVQRLPINKNKFQIADAKSSVKQFILLLRPYLQTCLVFKKSLHYSHIYHVALKCKCL